MRDSEIEREEWLDQLAALSDYYSEVTGRYIEVGDYRGDLYINSIRTNGEEYCETLDDVDRRIKQLFPECFTEDFYGEEEY